MRRRAGPRDLRGRRRSASGRAGAITLERPSIHTLLMSKLMVQDDAASRPPRDLVRAMLRGLSERCPSCGEGRLFGGYLKVRETARLRRGAASPPRRRCAGLFAILIVGHLIVGGGLRSSAAFTADLGAPRHLAAADARCLAVSAAARQGCAGRPAVGALHAPLRRPRARRRRRTSGSNEVAASVSQQVGPRRDNDSPLRRDRLPISKWPGRRRCRTRRRS